MTKREIGPTRAAIDALTVLGGQIRLGRHARNWTAAELGARVGVSARTIAAMERGDPGVSIGSVLSAASVVGVPLFGAEGHELARLRRRGEERVALIPRREYHPRQRDDDDDGLDF